jgi:hypothetical protein
MPIAANVTFAPAVVQTPVVVDAKLTVKPEEAVAVTANGEAPNAWFDSDPKVID